MFCPQAEQQLDWLSSVQSKLSQGTAATLQDVRRWIESGLGLGKLHPSCERAVTELRKLISTCQHCELKAARLLSNKSVCCRVYFHICYFYRAMHFSAKRNLAIACHPSVSLSVCNVVGSGSDRMEALETNCTNN